MNDLVACIAYGSMVMSLNTWSADGAGLGFEIS